MVCNITKDGGFICSIGSSSRSIIGKNVREVRRLRGYSLDKLVELTQLDKRVLWEIENRHIKPSPEIISKLAHILDVDEFYLTGNDPYSAVMNEPIRRKDKEKIDRIVADWRAEQNKTNDQE